MAFPNFILLRGHIGIPCHLLHRGSYYFMTPEQVASRLEPELRAALLAALQDVRDGVDYPALYAAIEAGDIDGVEKALNVEQGSWAPYVAAALAIFMQSGAAAVRGMGVRFDPTQDADFRLDLTAKVSAMASEQVAKAREYVWQSIGEGRPRREIAEGLAGRVSKATGKRQGGVIGLSGAQQSNVERLREALTKGDAEVLGRVLGPRDKKGGHPNGWKERDRRYDGIIKRRILEVKAAEKAGLPPPEVGGDAGMGAPGSGGGTEPGSGTKRGPGTKPKAPKPALTPDKIDEITGKYADRLLRKRAKDIASIETTQFAAGAKEEAVRQALAKAGLPEQAVSRTWHHSSIYLNARLDHVGMSGVTVQGLSAPFVMFDGTPMRYAHDPRGGAKHNASCRCRTSYSINWKYGER